MKTVCFIFGSPIPVGMKKVCLLDDIKNAGYRLLLLDVSYLINRESYDVNKIGLIEDDYAVLFRAKSYKDIKEFVYKIDKPAIVVTGIPWSVATYPIFRWLEKKELNYGYMSLNEYDDLSLAGNRSNIASRQPITIKRVVNAVFVRMPKNLLLKKGASFIVTNFAKRVKMYQTQYTANDATKLLHLHSNVFEEALHLKDAKRIVDEKYCVWLDSYIPYHTDGLAIGAHVNADHYYSSLRGFFKSIEYEYGIKVIIASHPKADYTLHSESYQGFQVVGNSTCLLCRDAEFVLTCSSMSTMYALMYKKPMVFIVQDSLLDGGLESNVQRAEYLANKSGCRVINIDSEVIDKELLDKCLNVDTDLYDKVIREWIKVDYDGTISGESCFPLLERFWVDFFNNDIS